MISDLHKSNIYFKVPFVFQGLDVEPQGWGDGIDIFSVKFLQDRCFPSIVQASEMEQ